MQLLIPDTANDKTEGWFEIDLNDINYEIDDVKLIASYEQKDEGYCVEFLCCRVDNDVENWD